MHEAGMSLSSLTNTCSPHSREVIVRFISYFLTVEDKKTHQTVCTNGCKNYLLYNVCERFIISSVIEGNIAESTLFQIPEGWKYSIKGVCERKRKTRRFSFTK